MRIIQVVPSIASLSSGPTYTVTRLSEQLRDMGHDVEIACIDRVGHRMTPDWVNRFPQIGISGKLMMSPRLHRWLRAQAMRSPLPVVHNNSLWQMPNLYSAWVAKKLHLPYVVSPHGTLVQAALSRGSRLKPLMWATMQRRALAAATCLHATAASEAREIRGLGLLQPIAVIPNGVDVPEDASGLNTRHQEILFLGRIHPTKGIDVLLRAWSSVYRRFPGWHLRIVGPDGGDYAEQMKALAASLSLDRVVFAGELVGERRTAAYQRASLFVLPTRNENFAVAVAEALAHGVPAIVTKGAPWSGLRHHGCGWWIDHGESSLAKALVSGMSTTESTRCEMGARGRNWMRTDFSWSVVGRRMCDVYRWLLAGSPLGDRPESVELSCSDA